MRGSAFELQLVNNTTGASFKVSQDVPEAQATSAEWIAEAPSVGDEIVPLIDFGAVTFTSASATVRGKTSAIDSGPWKWQPLSMSDASGRLTATPSELAPNGTTFKITKSRR